MSSAFSRPVLIVEDHPLVAEITADLIARCEPSIEPIICLNAAQTVDRLDSETDEWFRIFLDLGVPGAYGLSLANEIRSRGLAGRCCVVTAVQNREYIQEVRNAGFLGYIFKAAPVAEFTEALRAILDGNTWFQPPASTKAPSGRLTRRQLQLLEALRLGLSTRQMAARLHLTEGTVNNYVAATLHIFEASSRAHAVARAIELGLLEPLS